MNNAQINFVVVGALLCVVTVGAWWMFFRTDLIVGEQLALNYCGSCHALRPGDPPRSGPTLWRVAGRRAGGLKGYDYSPAFRLQVSEAGFIWDRPRLEAFIENPQSVLQATNMTQTSKGHPLTFDGVNDRRFRNDLTAFLLQLGHPPQTP
ncbi:c-type cytochrome [Magnetofaba australis]|uniref:Putative cytochrome C n=1 Tax=Magnetofaba australis IT-1 TaxID=1434232 RepID=A0A1Y2K8N6_9PROT|nr:hypothetical protein [Magnetofaba australis]OSM06989.1 putative cytochrome C [Magnetofaba australis IT-1]